MSEALSFLGISKSFPKTRLRRRSGEKRAVFQGFSASVVSGEKVLLLGANGSGKSTLLKLAVGLCRPDAGRVLVEGVDAGRADLSRIGVMFSNQLLYSRLTGRQNLRFSAELYGCDDVDRRIDAAIERWKLVEFVNQPVEEYSSGMRAILALARATIHSPAILLLDEPATFLDQGRIELLRDYLATSDQTVVLSAQESDTFSDRFSRSIAL